MAQTDLHDQILAKLDNLETRLQTLDNVVRGSNGKGLAQRLTEVETRIGESAPGHDAFMEWLGAHEEDLRKMVYHFNPGDPYWDRKQTREQVRGNRLQKLGILIAALGAFSTALFALGRVLSWW